MTLLIARDLIKGVYDWFQGYKDQFESVMACYPSGLAKANKTRVSHAGKLFLKMTLQAYSMLWQIRKEDGQFIEGAHHVLNRLQGTGINNVQVIDLGCALNSH